jgi:AcrR family transcriptional regulator
MSADERREAVLEAAVEEFGRGGYEGTSTEAIARRVGVSQPYLFRLFPNKRAIFLAGIERCFNRIDAMWRSVTKDLTGEEALVAMGSAYSGLIEDRAILQMQLQMWAAACQDDQVRDTARKGMSRLWQTAQAISGADDMRVMQFMAGGMLLNVMAALDLPRIKATLGESLTGLAGH